MRKKSRLHLKPHLWLIVLIGVIVPRRLRVDWRQEWEAELRYRETLLADWDRLDRRNKLDLLWHSLGAFVDALWLQPRRLEDEMLQDLRYGLRMLLKHPGFAIVAAGTLALGIGVNTGIFTYINAMMYRVFTFVEPERVTFVWSANSASGSQNPVSAPDFLDWREQTQSYESLAGATAGTRALTGGGEPERISSARVTANFFQVLGITPSAGRAFLPGEEMPGADNVVLLSHQFWQKRYGGDPR